VHDVIKFKFSYVGTFCDLVVEENGIISILGYLLT